MNADDAAALARIEGMLRRPAPVAPHVNIIRALEEQDEKLQAKGFPSISAWWWEVLRAWLAIHVRRLVLRVGRRGGKSSTISRVAVCLALHESWPIPPGDVGTVCIISVDRREAARRLTTIRAILDALGEPYGPIDGGIQLRSKPIAFQVFTATIAGVSGPTCIFVFGDEVAKWRDADTGANPAREVLASVAPTMASQPRARMVLCSSPMGELDAHAAAMREGNRPGQQVAWTDSFTAHPGLDVAQSHQDEPNESKWRREYMAIPMEGTEESLLSAALIDRCTRKDGPPVLPREKGLVYVAAMDPGFTRNPWTLAVACMRRVDGKLRRSIAGVWQWQGTVTKPNDPELVLRDIATICRGYGIEVVESDQYERFSLGNIAERPDINLYIRVREWSGAKKLGDYESVVTYMADGQVDLPNDPQLRADLLGVRQRLTPNGFTIQLQEVGDRHCDYAPVTALCLTSRYLEEPPIVKVPTLPTNAMVHDQLMAHLQRRIANQEQEWDMGGPPDFDA